MPLNSTTGYELPATTVTPATLNTLIDPAAFNTLTADISAALKGVNPARAGKANQLVKVKTDESGVEASTLTVDPATGNLSLNTSSPGARFLRAGSPFGGAVRLATNGSTGGDRGVQLGRIDNAGNFSAGLAVEEGFVGVGTSSPQARLNVVDDKYTSTIQLNGYTEPTRYGVRLINDVVGGLTHFSVLINQNNGGWLERLRLSGNGHLTVSPYVVATHHQIAAPDQTQGIRNLEINNSAQFEVSSGGFGNIAACTLRINANTTTSRSMNASGTVNASGADYAEYMRKAPDCGIVSKGDIVGVNANGLLTDKWADAVSFLIKSTNPSYVGGDVWGTEEVIGMKRSVEPVKPGLAPIFVEPVYEGRDHDEEALATYNQRKQEAVEAHRLAVVEHECLIAEYELEHASYLANKTEFEQKLEAARQAVDRIAYAGQVPVNVLGAKPGDYILPRKTVNGGIEGAAVALDSLTLIDYLRTVGIVQNILDDGRANIRVKVA